MSELQTELDELPTDYRKAVRRPRGGIFFFLVVAALGATVACARYLSTEVRGLTLDPSLEKYVGWALWVLIATCGIAIAFWADEILFHGDFRRSFVVREKVDRDAAIARQFSKTPAIFSAVVAVGCFVGYQFANAAGSGYFQYYDTVGRHIAQVRMAPHGSVDPGEQTIAAFDALSKTGGPDVTQFLITQLDGEAPKLASYAAWAIGRRHEKYLRKLVVGPLLQATKSTDKALQTTARVALARFQVAAASPLLIESIQASQANNEALDIRLIWGLANTQQPESFEILSDLLYDTSPEVARGAAYPLAQLRDTPAGGKAVTVLEQGFAYDGKEWRSLSAIAKAITGGHWNGPRFFGLAGGGRA